MEGGSRGTGRFGAGGVGSSLSQARGRGGSSAEAQLRIVRHKLAMAKALAAELESENVALRSSAQYVVHSLGVGDAASRLATRLLGVGDAASRLATRLLHVPNRMHVLVKRGIRRGAVVGVAMAQAATGADLTGIDGFPEDNNLAMQDLAEFSETADAVEALVPVQDIVNNVE